jgi:murein DD-endopeptidase MepM/ murein hydrolase activator NlpD
MRAPLGTPIMASAAGQIVLAERLDVRGNHVVINHGWGVFTGYSHLSEIHVTRGQVVRQGQVVGLSGNTGRSGGPHIHWEVTVNGVWIDPARFLATTVP